jgi:hypothetical protein
MALLGVKVYFCESFFNDMYKDFTEIMETLPVPPFTQVFILNLYNFAWLSSKELIYIETKSRYLSIIKDFNSEVVKVTKPNKSILIIRQRTILKFIEFQIDIKRNVDFIKYGIFIELVLPIGMIFIGVSNLECIHYIITFVVLKIVCYLWTMSYDLRVKRAENNLTLNINRWLSPELEDRDYFEIKVLERTAKQFNGQKSINESIEDWI